MKKLIKNLKAPSFYEIFVILQIINLIASQNTNINPNDQPLQLSEAESEITRQDRALLLSTEADSVNEECPMCNKISEMPMELAEKINEVSDIDIFINNFVETTNSLSNISSSDTYPVRRRRAASNQQVRQATCKPIDTLINLVPPNEKDPTIFYFPSCVLVKQCGGCCAHSSTVCSPVDEVERTIVVKKTKFVNEPKFQNLGDVTVTIKEHNACKCLCKKTAADCNSLQKFIKNQCRCECLNYKEAGECAQNPKKLFDSNSCACVCRDTKECDYGLHYDQETCSCQPITDANTPDSDEEDFSVLHFGDHIHNETFEATDDIKYETEIAT